VHHSTLDMMQMIQQAAPDVPLLIFTHQQNAVDALSLIQAGAQDYMIKGRGDHQTLRRIFQYSLERYRYQKALQEANSRLEARIRDRTAELEHALQLANDLNREKTLVFANLTHELRTPLHAILNFSDFAREKYGRAPDEKILGYLDRIHKSGTRLLTLVDDILDLNKLKSEGREKHFEPTDLLALTEEALRDLQSLAEKRHIHTNLTREGENFTVSCNPHKIMQVLVNLLSNAYKFTPEHTEVAVQLEVDDNRKLCRLSVIDQGPGIPEEDLRSVFDEFSQSQKVNSGAFIKGTGLGLAICKEIINHHHGNMWAENQPGGGAKLSFELPIRQYGRETSHQQADEAGIA
jgi:signal transduction histidine kinase